MIVGLTDKVILVTGAASGIGAAIAEAAAEAGAMGLLLADKDAAGLARMRERLPAEIVHTCVADLADRAAPKRIAEAAIAAFGRIDGLVNAAGLTTRGGVRDGSVEDWDDIFAVNARAAFFLMQASVQDMLARKSPGTIVNILSMNAHCGTPELAIYAASKGALSTLTKNAAHAHLSDRIRVNGINLGWVNTPHEHQMQSVTMARGEAWAEEAAARLPLGHLITAEDAARLATYLLSDASAPMTGLALDLEQHVTGAPT
tara:strand:- start:84693 stop:85469 length:777 start_codon:yes stop_codon:yes gene_type:complete